jgi:hypothetical protein
MHYTELKIITHKRKKFAERYAFKYTRLNAAIAHSTAAETGSINYPSNV